MTTEFLNKGMSLEFGILGGLRDCTVPYAAMRLPQTCITIPVLSLAHTVEELLYYNQPPIKLPHPRFLYSGWTP